MTDPDSSSVSAADVYAGFLSRVLGGEEADFEALCASHPDLAEDLRLLHEDSLKVREAFAQVGEDESVSATLERLYGSDLNAVLETDSITSSIQPLLARLGADPGGGSRYQVRAELGRGGMGVILKVWDSELRRSVAMKVILSRGETQPSDTPVRLEPRRVGRFLDEAQITSQLQHPGIVPVHELGVNSQGRPFFTMQLVRGSTFRDVLDRHGEGDPEWNLPRVLGILLKACEAMSFAHAKGVIHRDLKPSNIMVGRFGEVYVMDWGLAKIQGRDDSHDLRWQQESHSATHSIHTDREEFAEQSPDSPLVTADGSVIGTPVYMSPEQARGNLDQVGPASDVYSLGAMLYHALTGQMPFVPPGESLTPRTVLAALIQGPPPGVRSLRPEVPAELLAICDKAMAREVRDRYVDVRELAADLRAYLETRVVRAYRSGAFAELAKWVQRNRVVATAVLLLLLGGAAFTMTERLRRQELALAVTSIERFSDLDQIDQLIDGVGGLWPARGRKVNTMQRWLDDASAVLGRRSTHESYLAEVRAEAVAAGLDVDSGNLRGLDDTDRGLRWRLDSASRLVAGLDQLATSFQVVTERRDRAATMRELTIDNEADAWDECLFSLAESVLYDGLEIMPQVGLVPLRQDPDSLLWEFWHVESGIRPELDEDAGRWEMGEDTGIVLVLMPAGKFWMGSQKDKRSGRNYDPTLFPSESGRVKERKVEPFFLSKYELTKGQWLRMAGVNPSRWASRGLRPEESTFDHPVDSVTWLDCREVLARYELDLPRERQWEYAARAGTSSVYWCGRDAESLEGRENVADQAYARRFLDASAEPWEDGHAVPAPVGSLAPNAFGLFDMLGNLQEWCRDQREAKEGEDPVAFVRGGSFDQKAVIARVAFRAPYPVGKDHEAIGVRPVRLLEDR